MTVRFFAPFGAVLLFTLLGTFALAESALVPDGGPPGSTVTISGGGFGDFRSTEVNKVFFNELPALVQRWEPDFIEVKVPLHVQDGPVFVVNGDARVQAGTFTALQPRIEAVVPAEVEPGKVLQVTGRHFGSTPGGKDPNTMFGVNQVLVGGQKAKVRRWRDDKIELVVPATAKTGEVVVRLASSDPLPSGFCCAPVDYAESNAVAVTVLPSIRVDPTGGPVGSKVVLFGEGFGETRAPDDLVLLDGKPLTIAKWDDKNIVAHVPLNASTGSLVLRRGGKERTLGDFTVARPTVQEMSPSKGPIGSLVRIRGEHFGNYTEGGETPFDFIDFDPGENKITIGGVEAIVYRWNDDLIDVWVPFSASDGEVVVHRGATTPNPDGSCCADRGVLSVKAGTFTVTAPKVESVTPMSAGIDEIVTIKGSGFGSFLKGREATDASLGSNAFLRKQIRLGENISRTEVLFNGVAALVTSWSDTEIKVQVPRRPLFGIGTTTEFKTDLAKGPLLVRRGSWDLLPDGTCCTEKKWITVDAGEFTILARGLPDQGFFNDPNQSYP